MAEETTQVRRFIVHLKSGNTVTLKNNTVTHGSVLITGRTWDSNYKVMIPTDNVDFVLEEATR